MPKASVLVYLDTKIGLQSIQSELLALQELLSVLSGAAEQDGADQLCKQMGLVAQNILGQFVYPAQEHSERLKDELAEIGMVFED